MSEKIQHLVDLMVMNEADELASFEAMPTVEVYNMEWAIWYAYQMDILDEVEEVTNG